MTEPRKPFTMADLDKLTENLAEEPIAEMMRKNSTPVSAGWVLVLPDTKEFREGVGPYPPRYVHFSQHIQKPLTTLDPVGFTTRKWIDSMKTIEVWSEGYVTNGMRSQACLMGRVWATSFIDAVSQLRRESRQPEYYNLGNVPPTHYGCKLYDNETQARKTFG